MRLRDGKKVSDYGGPSFRKSIWSLLRGRETENPKPIVRPISALGYKSGARWQQLASFSRAATAQ